jgi:hypothetical protein
MNLGRLASALRVTGAALAICTAIGLGALFAPDPTPYALFAFVAWMLAYKYTSEGYGS